MSDSYSTVYVFVRTDLPLAQQMVQALHAVYGMAALWVPEGTDNKNAPNIVLLGLPNVAALRRALAKLQTSGLGHYGWVEPEAVELRGQGGFPIAQGWHEALTAVCTVPLHGEQRELLKNYKLWSLRELNLVHQSGAVVKSDNTQAPLKIDEVLSPGAWRTVPSIAVEEGQITGVAQQGTEQRATNPQVAGANPAPGASGRAVGAWPLMDDAVVSAVRLPLPIDESEYEDEGFNPVMRCCE